MSLKSRQARKLASAGLAAVAALGVAASAAEAANVPDVTLEYTCKYPIVDKQPLSIKISSNIPTHAPERVNLPPFQINAVATAKGDTARAINTLNAYSIEGSSEAFADLEFPDGFVQEDLFVPLTVAPWTRPSSAPVTGDLVLTASGDTPSVQLEPIGDAKIYLDRITLNLVAKGQTGNIINVRKLTTDFDGNPVDPDTTPNDFNVYCKLNADQSNLIATIHVGHVDPIPFEVTGLKLTAKTSTSVELAWNAATINPPGTVKEYRVFQAGTLVKTVAAPATSTSIPGLTSNTAYAFSVSAVDSIGLESARSNVLSVTTDAAPPECTTDTKAPTVPGPGVYLPGDVTPTSVNLRWAASVDQPDRDCPVSGLDHYIVEQAGGEGPIEVPATATSYRFTGLGSDSELRFFITAVDKAGNVSESSEEYLFYNPNTPPTVPSALKGVPTATTAALSWTASTDDVKVAGYNIYRDGVKIGTSTTPTFTATGLEPGKRYSFQIEAFDEAGLLSPKSAAVDVTTLLVVPPTCPDGSACQGYSLAGSTQLKTLTKGVLPLKGGIDAQLNVSDGKFNADLTLNPTSGRLISLSFLPITVKISFAPSGKTTGTLDDANILRSKSLVRIKVSEVKLFGAIPLAGGNSCQTKSLSEINLTSTKAFEIFKGGTLTGNYAISDLNGCGPLNGLVSPLTAGKGNTISLDLTPKA